MNETELKRLCEVKCFLLDMDGTIYLGNRLFDGTIDFLNYLKETGRNFLFLTNNSSKDSNHYVVKLKRLGIEVTNDDVLTSGEATVSYLDAQKPGARVYLLGTPELESEFKAWGFTLTDENPDYVVLGFDMTLTYQKLVTACDLIRAGVPYIATHPDFNCPVENGYIPDAGSMIELIAASTGKRPKVIGKPNKEIIESAFRKRKYEKNEYAMVGDRLYTDVATGNNAGICSILVLSGEATVEDVEQSDVKPMFMLKDVSEILACLKKGDQK